MSKFRPPSYRSSRDPASQRGCDYYLFSEHCLLDKHRTLKEMMDKI